MFIHYAIAKLCLNRWVLNYVYADGHVSLYDERMFSLNF